MGNYGTFRCFTCGEYGHLKRQCPNGTQKTYLAGIEDTEGHPMAIRVNVGITPTARPPCRHGHSRLCGTDCTAAHQKAGYTDDLTHP